MVVNLVVCVVIPLYLSCKEFGHKGNFNKILLNFAYAVELM
jgi:hypothetical protein